MSSCDLEIWWRLILASLSTSWRITTHHLNTIVIIDYLEADPGLPVHYLEVYHPSSKHNIVIRVYLEADPGLPVHYLEVDHDQLVHLPGRLPPTINYSYLIMQKFHFYHILKFPSCICWANGYPLYNNTSLPVF